MYINKAFLVVVCFALRAKQTTTRKAFSIKNSFFNLLNSYLLLFTKHCTLR